MKMDLSASPNKQLAISLTLLSQSYKIAQVELLHMVSTEMDQTILIELLPLLQLLKRRKRRRKRRKRKKRLKKLLFK